MEGGSRGAQLLHSRKGTKHHPFVTPKDHLGVSVSTLTPP